MESSNMKNMVVLKNLHSNLIEEAIVVLKGNVKVKTLQNQKGNQKENKQRQKREEYIVKEAEMHIAQYVSGIENHKKEENTHKDLEKKYMRLKRVTSFFALLAVLGMVVNLLK